ncbi:MAG: ribosome biogenesis GTPase Der [Campylobacterales bacterium]|nr:ribosome biogenesis GTPase Der [Campylobacterales bacterium]
MKKLAIIGKPNVGKSSFFNRILKERDAITSEQAGTTRDVKRRVADILGKKVALLDTGGLDEGNELFDKVRQKSLQAAYEADIILYMVDGKSLPEQDDKKLFYQLESMGKSVALVVNKIDNDKMQEKLWEFYEFGAEHIFGISVAHNRNVTTLLSWVAEQLPDEPLSDAEHGQEEVGELETADEEELDEVGYYEPEFEDEEDDTDYAEEDDDDDEEWIDEEEDEAPFAYDEIPDDSAFGQNDIIRHFEADASKRLKVAIIGRVNVGKSSLLNALLGEERSVVSSVAGTTIDPIDEMIQYGGREITFVDTAGIRKRGKILGIEKFALMRTEQMLEGADIALLVLDASEPFKELDEKIAGLIDENRLGCMIVLNKWDVADKEKYKEIIDEVRYRFKFLHYAPIITVSAQSKQRVHKIFDKLLQINENYSQRIPTSQINEVIELALRRHTLPSMKGQRIRIYYATQYETRPPRIALVMNKPKGLHFTYRRYISNQLRKAFNFEGVPLLLKAKKRGEK